jgi:hypothetical protein
VKAEEKHEEEVVLERGKHQRVKGREEGNGRAPLICSPPLK